MERTRGHFRLLLKTKARHGAKLPGKEQGPKPPPHPLSEKNAKSHSEGQGCREEGGSRARDSSIPIAKHQPHLGKRPPPTSPTLLTRFLFSPLASSAFGQNVEETPSANTCSPGGPCPQLPNIWTCSGEPLISGNFFPHLICLFKENKLFLIRSTAGGMFSAS